VFGRLQNIIWRGRIISRSWGWSEWRDYDGPSDHFDHAHFSARYLTRTESDTRPWGVQEEDMPLDNTDLSKVRAIVKEEVTAAVNKVFADIRFPWSADPADPSGYQRNAGDFMGDVWAAIMRGTTRGGAPLPEAGVFGRILAKIDEIAAVDDVPTKAEVLDALRAELREVLRDGSLE